MAAEINERQHNKKTSIVFALVLLVFPALFFGSSSGGISAAWAQVPGGIAGGPTQAQYDQMIAASKAAEAVAQEPQEQQPLQQQQPQFEDLDCKDITERNFAIDPNNDPHNFDGDNDGIGCEAVVVVDAVIEQIEEEEEAAQGNPELEKNTRQQLVQELNTALAVAQVEDGNFVDTFVHLDNALTLAEELEQIQAQLAAPSQQQPQIQPEPVAPLEEEEEPAVAVSGNQVDPVQVFGATLQECIDEILNAGLVIVETTIQQEANQTGNTEVVEVIEENPQAVEEAMNETGTTEEIVEVIAENLPEIASNQTTVEEVVEEEIAPVLEENVPEIEEEIIS